ncbi:MAG: AsmA-like C-terminal region-containing protein [Saprospiraceae bacterium]
MNAPPQKRPKSLFRKLLKIGLIGLLLLLFVAVGLCVYGVWYVGSDKVKTFDNLAFFGGGSLSVGAISISDVWAYPEIDLIVCDLHVWEEERKSKDSAFFVMDEGRIRLRADLLNKDTILLRQVTYNGGRVHLVKDDQNRDASERMRGRRPRPKAPSRFKIVGAPDLVAGIQRVDVRLANPNRGKDYAGFINRLVVSDLVLSAVKRAQVDFDIDMKGLTFKAENGAFVSGTRLQGILDFQDDGRRISAKIPSLLAGTTLIDFEASIFPDEDSLSVLNFHVPSIDMAEVRPMLSPNLQSKITEFNVDGPFYADVKLLPAPIPGDQAQVRIDLRLRGNRAKVDDFVFEDSYLNGTFYNRLPGRLDDFKPTSIGSTFEIDTVSATGFGFDFTTARAQVVSPRKRGSFIEANLIANGPAKSLSRLLKSDQFLFTRGEVEIKAALVGPLTDVTQLLDQSNGLLHFTNPQIRFVEAGVQLPLKHLTLDKQGNVANVDLAGFTLLEKHSFHVSGEVAGVSRIIGGANPEPVSSTVKVESPHLSWADLADYLGTKSGDEHEAKNPEDTTTTSAFDPASLKVVVSSIESSFQPKLDVVVDTLSYLDVSLTAFHTGMHFQGKDTLVLERTTFLLDTAKVGFGGSICFGEVDQTSYKFSLKAKHVDVEKLLPKINYVGSKLLAELKTLPNDVDIEVDQLGFIHDRDGIIPNASTGFINLVSNKQKAFRARVDFEPDRPDDPNFHSTIVKLEGNAVLFNDFFDTEEFLFQDGDFDFSMAYTGLVPDIKSLVQKEEMSLDFRNGRVMFKSADLEIPIKSLTLDMLRDTAEIRLFLKSDELGQELRVDGIANNLSEVVLGETGKQFSTQVRVESERIVWKDLNALIGSFAGERDTSAELNLRKTTRAIMTKFRPDVHLRIGELQLNNSLAIQEVESGLRMDDQQRLYVDTTGFIYGDGSMQLAGSVDLADLSLTPFDLYLHTEELNIASILEGFDHFGITSLKETKILEGKMSLELDLDAEILGESGMLRSETAKGIMSFSFSDLEVDGLQQIDDLAKKFRMTNRLDDLKFATLTNVITLDTNTVHLPLMEVPTSAFRVFVAGDMELGKEANVWVTVPLANLKAPDSLSALRSVGYAAKQLNLHVEFAKPGAEEALKTKLRWSRRKYYKQRQQLAQWKADKKKWRQKRKAARQADKD